MLASGLVCNDRLITVKVNYILVRFARKVCTVQTSSRVRWVSKEDRCYEQCGDHYCEISDPPGTDPARIILLQCHPTTQITVVFGIGRSKLETVALRSHCYK